MGALSAGAGDAGAGVGVAAGVPAGATAAGSPTTPGAPPSRRFRRSSTSRYWLRMPVSSVALCCWSSSTWPRRARSSSRSAVTWLSRSTLPWLLAAWDSSAATRSPRLARCAAAGGATRTADTAAARTRLVRKWLRVMALGIGFRILERQSAAGGVPASCRRGARAAGSAGGVGDLYATVLSPAILAGGGAGRALFAVAGHRLLAGRTTVGLQRGRHAVAAALAEAQVVVTAAALVGMAFQGDAGRGTVTQVLCVAGHGRLELRTHRILVEVEVDRAL